MPMFADSPISSLGYLCWNRLHARADTLNGSTLLIVDKMTTQMTTQVEIVDIACTFPAGKSAGYDNIPMSIIKRSIGSISSPLTHIINLSIIHGIVPDELKISRVVPIFKSGDKALFSNYRPISVLPYFSKFLERIIYNRTRIINYLNDFNLLCDNQYGFRKNLSLHNTDSP